MTQRDDAPSLQADLIYEADHGFYVTKRSADLMRRAAMALAQAPVSETGDRNAVRIPSGIVKNMLAGQRLDVLEEAALFVETRELLFARTRAEGGAEGAREVDDIKEYLVRGIRGLRSHDKTSAATAAQEFEDKPLTIKVG